MQESTTDLVTRKNKIEEILKKAFTLKLLELCETRTNKANPEMLSFYVVLAGHDKVTGAGRDTTCGRKLKTSSLQELQKMKEHPKTLVLTGKCSKVSDEKKYKSTLNRTTPKNTRPWI